MPLASTSFPLREIRVTRLWNDDAYTYSIPIGTSDPVTLIHGINGCGKTTFLKLISYFGSGRIPAMTAIPFESLTLEYETGTLTIVQGNRTAPASSPDDKRRSLSALRRFEPERLKAYQRHKLAHTCSLTTLTFTFERKDGSRPDAWEFEMSDEEWATVICDAVEPVYRKGLDTFEDTSTNREFSAQELIAAFRDYPGVSNEVTDECPQWLQSLADSCDLRLIETQRLQRLSRTRNDAQVRYRARGDQQSLVKTVDWCAADMQKRLADNYSTFAETSQRLDRDFTIRVLAQPSAGGTASPHDIAQLKNAYEKVRGKQQKLSDAHIYGDTPMPEFPTRELTAPECGMLVTFVSDMDSKLAAFDSLHSSAAMFLSTINGLLQGKEVELDGKKDGMAVRLHGRHSHDGDVESHLKCNSAHAFSPVGVSAISPKIISSGRS